MENLKEINVYASAIYEKAVKDNKAFAVLEVLDLVKSHIKKDEEFKKFLEYPLIENETKKNLVDMIYSDIPEVPIDILNYLIDKNKLKYVEKIYDEYLKLYHSDHDRLVVTAIFAKKLNDEQREKLIKNLEKMKKKKILLNEIVDESIIAGGIIKISDEIIDGSVKSQIDDLKNRL